MKKKDKKKAPTKKAAPKAAAKTRSARSGTGPSKLLNRTGATPPRGKTSARRKPRSRTLGGGGRRP